MSASGYFIFFMSTNYLEILLTSFEKDKVNFKLLSVIPSSC